MTNDEMMDALMLAQNLIECEPDKMDSSEAFQTIEQGRHLAKIIVQWFRNGDVKPPSVETSP